MVGGMTNGAYEYGLLLYETVRDILASDIGIFLFFIFSGGGSGA